MTSTRPHTARDSIGRFAAQENSQPELTLVDAYLDDESTGEDFDVHETLDALEAEADQASRTFDDWVSQIRTPSSGEHPDGPHRAPFDEEAEFHEWIEGFRTPEAIDEQIERQDPNVNSRPASAPITIGAWGSETPF